MKTLLLYLLSFSAFAQELWEVEPIRKWPNRKEITPAHGQIEDWKLGDDTARYWKPDPNKNYRNRTITYDADLPFPWEIRPGVFAYTWIKESSTGEAHVYFTLGN